MYHQQAPTRSKSININLGEGWRSNTIQRKIIISQIPYKASKTEYIFIYSTRLILYILLHLQSITHVVSLSPIFGAIAFLCAVHWWCSVGRRWECAWSLFLLQMWPDQSFVVQSSLMGGTDWLYWTPMTLQGTNRLNPNGPEAQMVQILFSK